MDGGPAPGFRPARTSRSSRAIRARPATSPSRPSCRPITPSRRTTTRPTRSSGVVRAGPFTYGMGDKIDRSARAALEKGYHVTMRRRDEPLGARPATTDDVQVAATGPFAITYANPKDDPRDEVGFAARRVTAANKWHRPMRALALRILVRVQEGIRRCNVAASCLTCYFTLDLLELQLHRRRPPEDRHANLHPAAVEIELLHQCR